MNRYVRIIPAAAVAAILVLSVCIPAVTAAKEPLVPLACRFPKDPVPEASASAPRATHGGGSIGGGSIAFGFPGSPYTVGFSDLTEPPANGQLIASRYWNFGDGATSTEKDPVHTYAGPGTYHGLLSVTTNCGSEYTKKIAFSVVINCHNPIPHFSPDRTSGSAPLTVRITDTSTDISPSTQWTYRFDPTHTSHDKNPVFTFTGPGTYQITQTLSATCNPGLTVSAAPVTITVYPDMTFHSIGDTTTVTTTPSPSELPAPVVSTTTAAPAPVLTTPLIPATTAAATASMPSAAPAMVNSGTGSPQNMPSAPGTGTLSVATNPPGAQVFIDDVLRGLSPTTIPELPAGPHTLRLEKSGYRNMTVPVSIGDGRTTDYSTALEAESGGMGITPIIAAVLVIAAVGGGAYWYTRKKGPETGGQT